MERKSGVYTAERGGVGGACLSVLPLCLGDAVVSGSLLVCLAPPEEKREGEEAEADSFGV